MSEDTSAAIKIEDDYSFDQDLVEVGQSGQIDDTFGNGPKGTPRWFGSAA